MNAKWHTLVAGFLTLAMLIACTPKVSETEKQTLPAVTTSETPTTLSVTTVEKPTDPTEPTTHPTSATTSVTTVMITTPNTTTATSVTTPVATTTIPTTITPNGLYTGPLFDAHLHLSGMYQGTKEQLSLMKVRSSVDLISYLDRNKVNWAPGFYGFETDKNKYSLVSIAETIIKDTSNRIIPLLMPTSLSDFASGQYTEGSLRQYLQPSWLCQGVGEIVLKQPELQSVTFDSPVMQSVFRVVNDMKGIVMIHPSGVLSGGRTTELVEIEPSIQKYPDTIFIFHPAYSFDLVASLMSKYPNVYYSMDVHGSLFIGGYPNFYWPGVTLYPTNINSSSAEKFLTAVESAGINNIVNENIKLWAPRLLQYPDRILWGTDFGGDPYLSWHFEDSVTDMVIKISREFIGRLPVDIQENYAYRMLGEYLEGFCRSNLCGRSVLMQRYFSY